MPENNIPTPPPAGGTSQPPKGLPTVEGEKRFLTHTMEEDITRARTDPSLAAKLEEAKKPFAEKIPPPPPPQGPLAQKAGGTSAQDVYREPIGQATSPARDEFVFPRPEMEADTQKQDFQLYVPPKRKGLSGMTIALLVILLLLLAGGGAGYWYFFMREASQDTTAAATPTPPPPPPPPAPEPVPPPHAPEPEPEPVPPVSEPEPIPPPPAPEPEPVPPPAPPVVIAEPAVSEAVLTLDRTVTVEIAALDKTTLLAALDAQNKSVTQATATIRYLVKLSAVSEKRYLTLAEIGNVLGFSIPASLTQHFSMTDFVGYKSSGTFRYGFAASVTSSAGPKSAALSWEQTALDNLVGLYIEKAYVKPNTVSYSTNSYLGFYKRFLNMPQPDVSFDWAVSEKYFVVATSKDMIFALLDEAGPQPTPQVEK